MLKFTSEKITKLNIDFGSKNFVIFCCSLIFLLSIYLRSIIDIGGDTAVYLDLGKKISLGGKYYYDFFESNFPISFWIYALQYKISQILDINPIIFSEIFINFFAVISIFYCSKILKKSPIYQNKAHYNLILVAFFLGFFLRGNVIQLGEFGTKSSFLLMLFFPYLSFSLIEENKINAIDRLQMGILMGLIPCFKPHYLLIILAIEIAKFSTDKSIKFFIRIDKLIMILIGLIYLNLMLIFTKEFFEFIVPMWPKIYPAYDNLAVFVKNIVIRFSSEISIYLFIFLLFAKKKISSQDKILIAAYLGFACCVMVENIGTIDQIGCLIAVSTIIFLKFSHDLIAEKKIILSENKFILLAVLILPILQMQILPKAIFSALGFINLWWILAFFYPFYHLFFFRKKTAKDLTKSQILLIFLVYYLCFFSLILAAALIIKNFNYFFVGFNLTSLFLLIFCFEKFINFDQKKLSLFANFLIISSFSCLFYLYISPIANLIPKKHFDTYPSELNNSIYQLAKENFENKDDSFLVFSNLILHQFPSINYLKAENYFKTHIANIMPQRGFLAAGKNFELSSDVDKVFTLSYLFDDVKKLLSDKRIKFIAINNDYQVLSSDNSCKIGFLEYYFNDAEFKKLFNENFQYSSRLTTSVPADFYQNNYHKKSDKIDGDKFLQIAKSKEKIRYNFEFYIRK
jgi:hypothetical protein